MKRKKKNNNSVALGFISAIEYKFKCITSYVPRKVDLKKNDDWQNNKEMMIAHV